MYEGDANSMYKAFDKKRLINLQNRGVEIGLVLVKQHTPNASIHRPWISE